MSAQRLLLPPSLDLRQATELGRIPVGIEVRVRGAGGMGIGKVLKHVTAHEFTDGRVIPFIGYAKAAVSFRYPDGEGGEYDHVEILKISELVPAKVRP